MSAHPRRPLLFLGWLIGLRKWDDLKIELPVAYRLQADQLGSIRGAVEIQKRDLLIELGRRARLDAEKAESAGG